MTTKEVEERLVKAGIDPEVWAEYIWEKVESKVKAVLMEVAWKSSPRRNDILASVIGGLAARWSFGDKDCTPPQKLAEMAERLTDHIMLQEQKRTGV